MNEPPVSAKTALFIVRANNRGKGIRAIAGMLQGRIKVFDNKS